MIDPGFWQSENMAKLTIRQRLLFIGLFSNADDEGRLGGKPTLIRSIVFPYEDIALKDIETDLKGIQSVGSIIRYNVNGNSYIQITGWSKYQRVDKPRESNIPAFVSSENDNDYKIHSENDSKNDSKNESEGDSCLKENKENKLNNNGQSASNDAASAGVFDAEFEYWWKPYPRKRGKTEAQKHWRKLRKKGVPFETLAQARNNYIAEMKGRPSEYIMHGSTFLGPGERWKDYLEAKTGVSGEPFPERGSVAHLIDGYELEKIREQQAQQLSPLSERLQLAKQEGG